MDPKDVDKAIGDNFFLVQDTKGMKINGYMLWYKKKKEVKRDTEGWS